MACEVTLTNKSLKFLGFGALLDQVGLLVAVDGMCWFGDCLKHLPTVNQRLATCKVPAVKGNATAHLVFKYLETRHYSRSWMMLVPTSQKCRHLSMLSFTL